MTIELKRIDRQDARTIGILTMGDNIFYTLEDKDRGLTSTMSLLTIKSIKVKSETAIPTGTYEIAWTFSNRFQRFMPELLNVPGFGGIRIHVGNKEVDTDGCLLLGLTRTTNSILSSKAAIKLFETQLLKTMKKEKVFIKIS